ncbi:Rnase Y domain-containing protein, partial [Stieleria sp.]
MPHVLPLASFLDELFFLYSLAGVLAGAVLMMGYQRWKAAAYKIRLAEKADKLMDEANREAEALKTQILLEAKEEALEIKTRGEAELAEARRLQLSREQTLDRRAEQLDNQEADLRKQQRGLENSQQRLDAGLKSLAEQRDELKTLERKQRKVLEAVSGMTRAEAAEQLMKALDEELEHERGKLLLKKKKQINETIKEKSREMLLTAIQRYASAYTADSTTSTVDVPTDDMKGRIIGREGRNIRAFEKATGIDVIIDDTPGVVIVSGFDPVRREIARRSLANLIADGRIHPSKIEEVVEETKQQINELIIQKGREAADEVDV